LCEHLLADYRRESRETWGRAQELLEGRRPKIGRPKTGRPEERPEERLNLSRELSERVYVEDHRSLARALRDWVPRESGGEDSEGEGSEGSLDEFAFHGFGLRGLAPREGGPPLARGSGETPGPQGSERLPIRGRPPTPGRRGSQETARPEGDSGGDPKEMRGPPEGGLTPKGPEAPGKGGSSPGEAKGPPVGGYGVSASREPEGLPEGEAELGGGSRSSSSSSPSLGVDLESPLGAREGPSSRGGPESSDA